MKWTLEQEEAINKEGSNIIVSAGAGSGKTAVLSERVLRKVKEGVDIRDILILTFTNEAAGEMKDRIRKKIKKAGLTEQLEYIDAAYITTFDAYALAMVKKYHYLLNISKNISIIDASIIDLEKEKIIEEIFLELYENKDSKFLKLVGDFTTRDDKTIKEAILNINRSLDLRYDKEKFLNNYINNYFREDNINSLVEEYFLYLKNLTELVESDIYELEGFVEEKFYLKLYETYSVLFKPKCYNDLYKIKDLGKVQFRNIPEEGIKLKEAIKSNVSEIMELSKYSEEELKEQIISTKDYVEVIIKIILKLDQKLNAYKYQNESFEFTDIAKMAIKIVKDEEAIRLELKNSYNEILIDEYQDTNDLQEMFIKEIENNNVYMVGDIKQSIYRFRNANPSIFKNKYDSYAKNIDGKKIDLLKNFRSRKEVLDNINEIFNLIMTEDFGGVNYQNNHAMVYGNMAYINEGNNTYNNNMELIKYDNDNKEYSNVEIEAFIIANDIKNKLNSNYQIFDFDLMANRDIMLSDFCIILDRGSDMPKYKKIFEYLNIPMDVYKDSDLVSANDLLIIKNIISLILKIKAKEYDTKMRYYFTSIARSFIGGLLDSEILKLLDENTFYNTEIYKVCNKLALDLDNMTPNILLERIIEEFDFYKKLIKVGNVEAGIMRLEYLLDITINIENLGYTITTFNDYLEKMIKGQKEIRYKETRGVGNCVKIMNIHKSKGLEFPICYFAGFKKDFNLRDLQSRFMYDIKYGILTPFYKEGIGTLITKTLIKNSYYKEEISEKIRLFYVALTRAKEKMIMVMPKFDVEMKQSKQVDPLVAVKYRSFYDFMNSISLNLKDYTSYVDLKSINLTKDYDFSLGSTSKKKIKNIDKLEFRKLDIVSEKIENKHASKTITELLTLEDIKKLEYGNKVHSMLEQTDFKRNISNNKIVEKLMEKFNFKEATIYQELEFIFDDDGIEYHGIIDLMLEYEKEIKIIDYKLKDISDKAYLAQLNVYYKYVKSISKKHVNMYLYSIIDNEVKEVKESVKE